MIKEFFKYKGSVKLELNGLVVLEKHNLVVTTGRAMGLSRLFSNAEFAPASTIAIGSGSAAPALTDTALGSQLAIKAFDNAYTRNGQTVTVVATFGPGVGTGSITETGLFNALAAPMTMFSRTTFTARPKDAGDTLAVTWTVQVP